ncbi:hypothetical protein [Actinomadura kijaniata]|uniref:hypothetical protein n=1 Tax=Actinomadura kijaniata TaxID=46161 RepID=UPI0012FC3E97|nr:hypothetical protein [Actinomadura kijaniata]
MTRPVPQRTKPPDHPTPTEPPAPSGPVCLSCHDTGQMWNPPAGPIPCPPCTPPPVRSDRVAGRSTLGEERL